MMGQLTVACVLRSGEYRARRYSPEHVWYLQGMVTEHLPRPHRFVCLSDLAFDLPGGEVRPLRHEWPGWWSKIELFSPVLDDAAHVLYIDLDVKIVQPLDAFIGAPMLVLANRLIDKPKPRMCRRYQSSVMAWPPPEGRLIYEYFVKDPDFHMREWYGDQDFIGHVAAGCPTFPRDWVRKQRAPGVKVIINVKDHEPTQPSL